MHLPHMICLPDARLRIVLDIRERHAQLQMRCIVHRIERRAVKQSLFHDELLAHAIRIGDGLPRHRLGLAPVGAEAAVEHDEDEGKGADVLGQTVVVKGNLDHPVRAEEHAQQNEGQQGGHPQLAGELVAQHAGQDDKGGEKQQMGHKQSFQYRAWEGKTYHITILVSLSYQDNAAMTSPDRGPVKREKKERLPKNSCFLQATPL